MITSSRSESCANTWDNKMSKGKKSKTIHEAGKRKRACAQTTVTEGGGDIRINSVPLGIYGDDLARMRVREPLKVAGGLVDADKLSIRVKVAGGGFSGQTDAIRTSMARALITYAKKSNKDEELRERLIDYDRSLVSGDPRRTEPHKPSKSSKGPRAKRQKSYR